MPLNFTTQTLDQARSAGYKDDQIWQQLSSQDPRFEQARQAGYTLDQTLGYLGTQQGQDAQPAQARQEGAGASAPQQEAPAAPAGPAFFSPGEIAKRAGMGALELLPGGEAAAHVAEGKPAYGAGAEGAAQKAQDIGLGAGDLAALLGTEGVGPLLKFLGIGSAMNAAGIPQAAAKAGGAVESFLDKGNKAQYPSKVAGIEGLGTFLNGLGYAPGAIADSLIEAVPYYLAGRRAMAGNTPVGAGEGAAAGAPPEPTAADLLRQHGGETTPAMTVKNPVGRALAGGIEKLSTINPLTEAIPESIRAKNVGAIQKYMEKQFGPEVVGLGARDYGPHLASALDTFNKQRGMEIENAENAIAGLPVKGNTPVGAMAARRINQMLEEGGVPFDENGFNADLMTGNEGMNQQTARDLMAIRDSVVNARSIQDLVNQRRNIDASGIPNYEIPPDRLQRFKNMGRGIVNDTLTQAINPDANPEAAAAWKAANAKYADTASLMRRVKGLNLDDLRGPEAMGKMFTNPTIGGQILSTLKDNMAPEQWKAVQGSVINQIIDQSRDASGNVSAASFKTNVGKRLLPIVEQLDPEHQKSLGNAAKMMDLANLSDMRKDNPSGTSAQLLKMGHLLDLGAGLVHPAAAAPVLGETAASLGYYGANRVVPPTLDMIKRAAMATREAANKPIPFEGGVSAIANAAKNLASDERGSFLPEDMRKTAAQRALAWKLRNQSERPAAGGLPEAQNASPDLQNKLEQIQNASGDEKSKLLDALYPTLESLPRKQLRSLTTHSDDDISAAATEALKYGVSGKGVTDNGRSYGPRNR